MLNHYLSNIILTFVVVSLIATDMANASVSREDQEKVYNHEKFLHRNSAMNRNGVASVIENEYILELQDNVTDVEATVRGIIGMTGTIQFVYQHVMKGAAITVSSLMTNKRMISLLDNTIVKRVSQVCFHKELLVHIFKLHFLTISIISTRMEGCTLQILSKGMPIGG
jgi:hypothetical protein